MTEGERAARSAAISEPKMAQLGEAMSRSELLALPPAVPLEIGNRALDIGRTKGYELARRGEYPCKLLRVGSKYRVITADLWRLLGVHANEHGGSAA
jgi:hypothetical protein